MHLLQGDSLLCNSQAVWATLLTGKSWREHRCTGYSTPGSNIDEPRVFEITALGDKALLDTVASAQTALINLPLIPGGTTVRGEAVTQQPIRKPKEGRHPALIWEEAVEADCRRIALALPLLEQQLQLVVCRLTSFDTAGHLLFDELFSQPRPRQELVLATLGAAIDTLLRSAGAQQFEVLVVSNYSFERCISLVNVNHMLEGGGYCVSSLASKSRRILALKSIVGDPEALRWHIEPERSGACSPVHGTVFCNSRNRFSKGILDENEAKAMLTELPPFLEEACKQRYGLDFHWQTIADDPLLPDMVFRIPGADYTFSEQTRPGDTPTGVHEPSGFLALPGPGQHPQSLTSIEASKRITGLIGGGQV